ncbi:MAG: DNA cytosine methyltransferase [Anaerolineales bacterium]|nr:DNA cytosine methyltransferase [Anaerolineales bacterium]MCW5854629.1 DNA cytosine methyltransferase [Anaerolineales bacterium]
MRWLLALIGRIKNLLLVRKPLIAIDVFSGAGGMTLGLKQAGFRVIAAVEVDQLAVDTYRVNHPEVEVWQQDVRQVSGEDILKALKLREGELDVLAGCPPCQGFSSIRTLNGKKRPRDERNDLIFDFLRLVEELKPKVVLLENVPALAKKERLVRFTRSLRKLGYTFSGTPMILNTADFGVPQRRRRMIFIGSRVGEIKMPEKEVEAVTVRASIGDLPLPGESGDPLHDIKEQRAPHTVKMIKKVPRDGGSRSDLPEEYHLPCHKKSPNGFKDVYGRMSWDNVAPTITSGCNNPSKGRFLHPTQHRAITLREAAIFQSFPKDYYFSLEKGKNGAAIMIGNALPPKFVQKQAVAIKDAIRASRTL